MQHGDSELLELIKDCGSFNGVGFSRGFTWLDRNGNIRSLLLGFPELPGVCSVVWFWGSTEGLEEFLTQSGSPFWHTFRSAMLLGLVIFRSLNMRNVSDGLCLLGLSSGSSSQKQKIVRQAFGWAVKKPVRASVSHPQHTDGLPGFSSWLQLPVSVEP